NPAAHPRGARFPRRRTAAVRRRRRRRSGGSQAQGRLRVPALRAVPPHARARQRRLRPARAQAPRPAGGRGDPRARRSAAAARAARGAGRALPDAALGRPAPARGARARVRLQGAWGVGPAVRRLDEPFGALDARVRKTLRRWLGQLHRELALTSVFVTHDQEEALELADRVVVMREGRIEQVATPKQVYDEPATPFVHDFLGDANRYAARIADDVIEIPELRLAPPKRKHIPARDRR